MILAGLWALLMPLLFKGVMDSQTIADTFPDGTFVLAMLVFGWMWPFIVVGIAWNLERKRRGDDRGDECDAQDIQK